MSLHSYYRQEQADGSYLVIQERADGRTRQVSDTYLDYVEWLGEGNIPEDKPYIPPEPYVPSFEENKTTKIYAIENKTRNIFAEGVSATVKGVIYKFDTRTGERAAVNWQILDSIITRCLLDPSQETILFPRNISTINDENVLSLDTASEANAFWTELMINDNAIAVAGATLRKAAKDATTQEELDLVIDDR